MAMIEEACASTKRNGCKDTLADNPNEISQADVIEINDDGAKLADEVAVGNEPHVMSSKEVSSTHTAAPELTQPGESQSNGLAERAVGMFEDQFSMLKHAL